MIKKRYTLKFRRGTVDEITGNKDELIGELYHMIDEIQMLDEEDTSVTQTVVLYDSNGADYMEARIEEN